MMTSDDPKRREDKITNKWVVDRSTYNYNLRYRPKSSHSPKTLIIDYKDGSIICIYIYIYINIDFLGHKNRKKETSTTTII